MFNGKFLDKITGTLAALQKTLEDGPGYPTRTFHTMDDIVNDKAIPEQLEKLGHRLDSLSLVVKDKVERMRYGHNRPTSNQDGLMSLPTDLLVYIIELVAAEKEEYDFRETKAITGRLSLVSRTFRHLVVNTASLWSKIDACYCQSGGFQTRIERSKDALLDFDLKVSTTWYWDQFLATALPFRHRCRSVNLDLSNAVKLVLQKHPCISFPRAEDAQISFIHRDNSDHLFAAWSFPAVKRLRLVNAVPPPGILTGVTSFSLKITDFSFGKVYHRITGFLKDLPNLQDLSLSLPSNFHQEQFADPAPVNLPTVTTLAISNFGAKRGKARGAFAAGKLFKAIKAPNASAISLKVAHLEEEDITTWIQSFPPTEVPFAKVNHVTYYSCGRLTPASLSRFLRLFPNIRALGLQVPAIISTIAGMYGDECPNLDQLREFYVNNPWRRPPELWLLEQVVDKLTDYPKSVKVSASDWRQRHMSILVN